MPFCRKSRLTKVRTTATVLACAISHYVRLKCAIRHHKFNNDPPPTPTAIVAGEESSECLEVEEKSTPNSEGTPNDKVSPSNAYFLCDASDPFPAPVKFTSETS